MRGNKYITLIVCILITGVVVVGAYYLKETIILNDSSGESLNIDNYEHKNKNSELQEENSKETIIEKYKDKIPTKWGEKIDGVINKVNVDDKIIFLTFDACGGKGGNDYDEKLINYLIKERVEATLFINGRWIDENEKLFKKLSSDNLFEIENHGFEHRPLSVTGREVYGINGTRSVGNVYDEIKKNANKIKNLTGHDPKFFRSGTAYYDDVAIAVANDLGKKVVGFNIIGDGGATFSAQEIVKACSNPPDGSIIIFHMNQPESEVYEGIKQLIPELKAKGYKFGKLENYL